MTKQVYNLPIEKGVAGGVRLPSVVSAAVRAGDFVFVSGLGVCEDPETGENIVGVAAQAEATLERMKKVLAMAGASLRDVVRVTAYLRYYEHFGQMNEVYRKYFPEEPPARKTIYNQTFREGPDLLVDFDCIAYHPVSDK